MKENRLIEEVWIQPFSKSWWLPPKPLPGFITLRGLVVPELNGQTFSWLRVRLNAYNGGGGTGLGLTDAQGGPVHWNDRQVIVRPRNSPKWFSTAWRMKKRAYKRAFRDGTLDVTVDRRRMHWTSWIFGNLGFVVLGLLPFILLVRGDFPTFIVCEAGVWGAYFALSTLGWVTGRYRRSTLCTSMRFTSERIEWTTARGDTQTRLWSQTSREELDRLAIYGGADAWVAFAGCLDAAFGRPKELAREPRSKLVLRLATLTVWPVVWVLGPVLLATWLFNPLLMSVFSEMGGRGLLGIAMFSIVMPVIAGLWLVMFRPVERWEKRRIRQKHRERRRADRASA